MVVNYDWMNVAIAQSRPPTRPNLKTKTTSTNLLLELRHKAHAARVLLQRRVVQPALGREARDVPPAPRPGQQRGPRRLRLVGRSPVGSECVRVGFGWHSVNNRGKPSVSRGLSIEHDQPQPPPAYIRTARGRRPPGAAAERPAGPPPGPRQAGAASDTPAAAA